MNSLAQHPEAGVEGARALGARNLLELPLSPCYNGCAFARRAVCVRGKDAHPMTETPNDDNPGFVANESEHCFACFRLICPGQTY